MQQMPFSLAALHRLEIVDVYSEEGMSDSLLCLIHESPPNQLKTLRFGDFRDEEHYSLRGTEELLRIGAPSLTELVVDPRFRCTDKLPAFPLLESLTLWLRSKSHTADFLERLGAASCLTRLIFRIVLYTEDDEDDREEFAKILTAFPPWPAGEPMKEALGRRFPRCRQVEFHFCIPPDSDMHFRRGLRRRMERRLRERLEETESGISDFLRIEWLDKDYLPVQYNRTNGKPPWKVQRYHGYQDPETEASDCESEKSAHSEEWDSDGNLIIREWTEADERAYRREMLHECGIYSDEERDNDENGRYGYGLGYYY
ncbi:hypothetical protein R3P38DRAFT_3201177 [Favolaschia claudopus]|uniref:Uncharacterized protein n=1 Tax=Favolaschia claudopus TaxID=2862362 RepID=A0AAW0AY25_9AGAR